MYLVDTNVISETDPEKSKTPRPFRIDRDAELYLTVVTLAELEAGVRKLARTGAARKAAALREWLDGVERSFASRILVYDQDAARIAGRLVDHARGQGFNINLADIQIAAIAEARGLIVLTRNVRDFAPLGVAHLDPFADDPEL